MGLFNYLKNKMQNDTHFKELLSGSFTALILRVVGLALSYIFIAIVSHIYGAMGVGIFALAFTFLNIYVTIGKVGTETAFLRFCAEYRVKNDWGAIRAIYKKTSIIVFFASVFVSIAAYYSSDFLAISVLKKPYMVLPLKIIALSILPFCFFILLSEGLRGFKKVKEYMILRFVGLNFFSIVFLVLFSIPFVLRYFSFVYCNKDISPTIAYVLSGLIFSIITYYLWIKEFNLSAGNANNPKEKITFFSLLSVSIPMLFSNSLFLIVGWADTIMLGIFKTATEVGYYNVASRIAKIIVIILMAINTIAAPKFAEFWGKKDIDGLVKIARQSTKMIFWATLPFFIFLIVFPGFVLSFFGKDFTIASLCLIILLIGFFFNAISGSVGLILLMTGYQVFHQKIMFIGALLNIVLNYLLIPKFGINGAAFASAVSMIFWNFSFGYKVKKITGRWIFYPNFLDS